VSVFSKERLAAASAQVPATASATLAAWAERARAQAAREPGRRIAFEALADACEAELASRGTLTFDGETAARHADWAGQAADLTLAEAIAAAFAALPPRDYETPLLRAIGSSAGVSHAERTTLRGKRDVSLILGHLIHDRHGWFRPFLDGVEPHSDLLLERDVSGRSVRYRFRPEAEAVFGDQGLLA